MHIACKIINNYIIRRTISMNRRIALLFPIQIIRYFNDNEFHQQEQNNINFNFNLSL